MTAVTETSEARPALVPLERLSSFCNAALAAAGADAPTVQAATRTMMHATGLGVDSHGVRLLPHYVNAIEEGRVNGKPNLRFLPGKLATEALDADDGHGALAAYTAMEHAIGLAERHGIGAIGVRNTSHFGAAGAYALAAAEAGFIGLAVCNSDSFVRLHDGADRFHGTNPIAVAAPVAGERPWLLDMATSAVPYNRVQLFRHLGQSLPNGVASNEAGSDIVDAGLVAMLAPLGGAFGYKGAGLAGFVEILSAVATGMKLSPEIAPMDGPDFSAPRSMGAFVLALDPASIIDRDIFETGMSRYLKALRASTPRDGSRVLAPGDREWAVEQERERNGAPIDPGSAAAFSTIAQRYTITSPLEREEMN